MKSLQSVAIHLTYSLLALFLALALCPSVWAQQQKSSQSGFDKDVRLTRKIAIRSGGGSLGQLLTTLTEKTGVRLTVARDVVEEKAVVFTPARPLRETMADLAALFGCQWNAETDTGSQEIYYRLVRTGKNRRREAQLLEATERRLLAEAEKYVRALNESPEQLKKRPEGDSVREILSHANTRLAVMAFAGLSPEQRGRLQDGEFLSIPFKSLGAQWQEPMRKMFMRVGAAIRQDTDTNRELSGLEQDTLQFQLSEYDGRSSLALMLDKAGIGTTFATVKNNQDWILPSHGDPYTGDKIPAGAALPTVKNVEAAAAIEWVDRLRKLAETTGRPVLADFYRSQLINRDYDSENVDPNAEPQPKAKPASPTAALDAFCHATGYIWWSRPGGALLFRKRDWFVQRQYEVPDPWLLSVATTLQRRKGSVTYGDLQRLTALTRRQIVGLNSLAGDREFNYGSSFTNGRGVHEIVAMVGASAFPPTTTILQTARSQEEVPEMMRQYEQKVLVAARFTARQRALLPGLVTVLAARGRIATPADLAELKIALQTADEKPVSTGQYIKVMVFVTGTSELYDTIHVYLPLQFSEKQWGTPEVQ
jgi:hypothetical protein